MIGIMEAYVPILGMDTKIIIRQVYLFSIVFSSLYSFYYFLVIVGFILDCRTIIVLNIQLRIDNQN